MNSNLTESLMVIPVSHGPRYHFFGYYDKNCWDSSGRWILSHQTTFMDRPPNADDKAGIGLIDTEDNNKWHPLAETLAWNWQQGSMLQWLNGGPEIIFNDRFEGCLISRILNVTNGKQRVLPMPIYTVNKLGTLGISLSFPRLHHQRPGYGYAGVKDPWKDTQCPEEDGLYSVDLITGESKLIFSIADAFHFQPKQDFSNKMHRFNHAQFNRDGSRFAVLHRYKTPDQEVGKTRLITLSPDGEKPYCLIDSGMVSHYDWCGSDSVLAWSNQPDKGDHYFSYKDLSGEVTCIGEETLYCDGHCSFSPDNRWVLTDTYPDQNHIRTLILFHWEQQQRFDIGRFLSPPADWQIRCDLHPRWSPCGKRVCIDSIHDGSRQVYVLDVSDIVAT